MKHLRLKLTEYIGIFYKKNSHGHWRQLHQIGNAGVASDVANLLRKLGFIVDEFYDE